MSIFSKAKSAASKAVSKAKSVASSVKSNLSNQLGALKSGLTASAGSSKGGLDYSNQNKILNSPSTKLINQTAASQKSAKQTAQNKIIQPYLNSSSYQSMARASGNTNVGSSKSSGGGSQYANSVGPQKNSGSSGGSSGGGGYDEPAYEDDQYYPPATLANVGNRVGVSTSSFSGNPNQPLINALGGQLSSLQSVLKRTQAQQAVDDSGFDEEDDDEEDRLRSLQEELLGYENPSGEEQDVEGQLANLMASKEMGLQQIGEQPIPLGFITGQQSAVEKRASTQAMPLQARLAQLQARRQSSLENARGRLGFAREDVNRAATREQDRRKEDLQANEFDRQQALEYARLAQQIQNNQQSQRYISVGDGSNLYDTLTGKIVSSNAKNFAPQKATTNSNPFLS